MRPAGSFIARGDEVISTMTVTEAMVGAPNRLHGGVMMAFFDEGMGRVPPPRSEHDDGQPHH